MDIKRARELLGEENIKYTDDKILDFIETARLFSNIIIEKINKMTPEELKKFKRKSK